MIPPWQHSECSSLGKYRNELDRSETFLALLVVCSISAFRPDIRVVFARGEAGEMKCRHIEKSPSCYIGPVGKSHSKKLLIQCLFNAPHYAPLYAPHQPLCIFRFAIETRQASSSTACFTAPHGATNMGDKVFSQEHNVWDYRAGKQAIDTS